MEFHTDVKKRFLPLLDRRESIIQDSSGLTEFKICHRRYFYKYVVNKKPLVELPYIRFGSAGHRFREVLSKSWLNYCKEKDSTQPDVDQFPDSYLLQAIKEAIDLFKKEGGDPILGSSKWDFMTIGRLVLSCKVAYEHWKAEKRKGSIIVIDCEVPINFEYANGNRKCGRVDEIVEWNGKIWPRDFKWSSINPAFYPKKLQIKDQAYTYITGAGLLSGKKINGILYEQMYNDKGTKKEDRGPSIHTHIIEFNDRQLANWNLEQELVHKELDMCREMDIYPMTENEYTCTYCPFYDVCTAMNENQMMGILHGQFKTELWDPMESTKKGET